MTATAVSWRAGYRKGADAEFTDILTDTGYQEHADSLGTEVPLALNPHTRYYWTVTVTHVYTAKEQWREEPYRKAELPERLQKLSESLTTEELAPLVCGGGTRGERLVTAEASGTTSKLYESHGIPNVILPGRPDQVEAIVAGVESGEVLLSDLKRSAGRVLRLIAENTAVSL